MNVDINNRPLHPKEIDWIKANAARYAAQKGISTIQAQQELTAQADRQVQSGSPGIWDQSASAFLSQAKGMLVADGNSGSGYMFYAPPNQKADPNMYASYGGSNNPSASDLAAAINRDHAIRQNISNATLAAAGAAATITGVGPGVVIGGAKDAWTAYKAAQASYWMGTAFGTGAVVGGASYTGGAAIGALYDQRFGSGQAFGVGFDQRFSYTGLATATTVGGLTGMYSTAMFGWAGVPNSLTNWVTVPGFVIRVNSVIAGKVAGSAAEGAVNSFTNR